MKPIRRWGKKVKRVAQRLLPFFDNAGQQKAFERLVRRRDALETRDAPIHANRARALIEQGVAASEAERIVATMDHSTRHPHDSVLLGKSRKKNDESFRVIRPRVKKKKVNWNVWRR